MKLEGGTLIVFILFFVIICCSALFSTIGYVSTEECLCPECEECKECKEHREPCKIDIKPISCNSKTKECFINSLNVKAKNCNAKVLFPHNLTNEEIIQAYSRTLIMNTPLPQFDKYSEPN
tara:strand:- start:2719 stop:3081 length:363 start_codon:yes stop_codon:yes gene_type:complete